MARLIERTEQGEVAHELLFASSTIGRGGLNDIVIADRGERRVHATVVATSGGRYVVRDNRSRGGTLVNGQRATGLQELPDGAELRVGGATFVFHAEEGEAAPAARPGATLGRGVVRLTLGTLAARVFGYVREMVAYAFFGCTGNLDAYVAATTLPNLFRDVLGEYAAENAFMPAFKTLQARGHRAAAHRLLRRVLGFVVVASSVLVVLGVVGAPWAVQAVVPGFAQKHPELLATATRLTRWMMPNLLIITVGALFGSLLLAERRFVLYSVAPIGMSVCAVVATVTLSPSLGVGSLAVGVVAGELVHMAICAAPSVRHWGAGSAAAAAAGEREGRAALRKVARSAIPIGGAAILTKVNLVVDQVLASTYCPAGRIAALYGAQRLLQLPFGIVGLAVGRAAFPSLIEQASSRDGAGFSREVVRALRLNTFLMLPAALGLVVLARPCVRLMFEYREFVPEHTVLVALALGLYATGLVAMGARSVLSRAFFALLNTRTPFALSALEVALNVALSLSLIHTPLQHGGLALGTSVATWVQAVLLVVLLGRELRRQGRHLALGRLWSGLWRMGVSGAAMAAVMVACNQGLGHAWAGGGLLAKLAGLGVPGAAGLGTYVATAWLLHCDEVRALLRRRRGADSA
ncbi:MAG TPA: murein biosynthesis integral membrane protein MurJ [Planctomycetota bacterium]|nr:murein biosynthesis integral membrane protein MurJ [Planctomycetota bacterium]